MHIPSYLAVGCLCMVSGRILTRIKRFGESVLEQAALSVQTTLPYAAVERSAEDLSAGPGGPAAL